MADQPNVTPEEQQMYDGVVSSARSMIYGDPKNPQDMSAMRGTLMKLGSGRDDPGAAIGHTAAMIMTSINGGLQKQGKSVPEDVLFHAGMEVIADLVQISETAKIIPPKAAPEITKQAIFQGLKVFGENQLATKRAAAQQPGASQQPPQPAAAQPTAPPQPPGIVNAAGAP